MRGIRLAAGAAALLLAAGLAGCAPDGVPLDRGEAAGLLDGARTALSVGEGAGGAFEPVCENERLRLCFQPESAAFYVEDKADGYRWYSNPPGRMEDSYAAGIYRMEMSSLFIVRYVNKASEEDSRFNTYTGSVMDGSFAAYRAENGLRLEFTFPEYDVRIPLEIALEEDGLAARIRTEEIACDNPDVMLSAVNLLPYFGAGAEGEEGYILVPDGSGGLIRFMNGKAMNAPYSRPVYGSEPTEQLTAENLRLQDAAVNMSLFGIRKEGHAFLAVADAGGETATLEAFTNKQLTSYAGASFDFALKSRMQYQMGVSAATVYERGEIAIPAVGVRYYLLEKDEADYNGMARRYQRRLIEEEGFQPREAREAALFADVYAGVPATVSRMGLRFDTVLPLTRTGEAAAMAADLHKAGIGSLVMRYGGWNKQELAGRLPDGAGLAGGLKSGGVTLGDLSRREDMRFYPAVDRLVTFTEGRYPFSRFFDPVGDIAGVAKRVLPYKVGVPDDEAEPYFLLRAGKVPEQLRTAFAGMKKDGCERVGLSDVGRQLYNDYSEGVVKRTDTRRLMAEGLAGAAETFAGLLLDSPNIYAVKYAQDICNVPVASSGQDLIDEDVPFYQLVVSRFARAAAPALNGRQAGEQAFLKVLETGSMPAYAWIYAPSERLANTPLSALGNAHYGDWLETAAEQYAALKEIETLTEGSLPAAHEKLADGVYRLRYANGAAVVVNYTDAPYRLPGGRAAAAGGYLAVEKGAEG